MCLLFTKRKVHLVDEICRKIESVTLAAVLIRIYGEKGKVKMFKMIYVMLITSKAVYNHVLSTVFKRKSKSVLIEVRSLIKSLDQTYIKKRMNMFLKGFYFFTYVHLNSFSSLLCR